MRQLLLLLPLWFGMVAGCKKEEPILPVEIVKFEVSGGASQIRAGETVTLAWEVNNAATVQIVATPPGNPLPNVEGGSGTVTTAALFEPTTFQLSATGTDGSRQSSTAIRVDVRGIRIQSFTATPNTIDPDQTSTLEWTIGGDAPTDVTLKGPDGSQLFSAADPTGSFDVTPKITSTYTLNVTAESGTDEKTVTVMVADVPPQIIGFTARPDPVAIGGLTTLSWETVGAYEVQVLQDGVVVRPWNTLGADGHGSVTRTISAPSTAFLLQARTQTQMMTEQMITVSGLEVPIIDQFDLTPPEYTEASTVATVVWSTTNTDTTMLRVNNQPVAGFPGTASGSYDFSVSGGTASVLLIATNSVGDARQTKQILSGFNDVEPNDTAATSIGLAGDGLPVRGTITAGDVDVYSVMVPQGARIHAIAGWDGTNCSFDTVLDLYDSDGTTRIGSIDDTPVPDIAPCSRIHPASQSWADDLAAGTYYLFVRGSTTAAAGTGQYALTVEVSGPESPLPGVTRTPFGNPAWTVVDVVQISILIGNGNTNPPFRFLDQTFNDLFLPAYTGAGFIGDPATVHPIFQPFDALDREYDGVLSALTAVAGYTSGTSFTRAEFDADNAILILFVLKPGPGAPVEPSYDFASGPVLPTSLFPMTMEYDVVKDGMPWYDGDAFELPGYNQYPPFPGSNLGASHRVTGAVLADLLAPDASDSAGVYQSTFVLTEANGASGWTITVPLTVTP